MPRQVFVPRFPNPLAIDPCECVPETDALDFTYVDAEASLTNRTVLTLQRFYAPVQLPQGAVVTAVKLLGYKNGAAGELTVDLARQDRVGTALSIMATATAPNWAGWGNISDTSISNAVVDNETYRYLVRLKIDPNAVVTDHRFLGCLIYWS